MPEACDLILILLKKTPIKCSTGPSGPVKGGHNSPDLKVWRYTGLTREPFQNSLKEKAPRVIAVLFINSNRVNSIDLSEPWVYRAG